MEENKNEMSNEEQKEYSRACTEVLEILKDAPPQDIAKIPKELLNALEEKKDKDYNFKTDSYMTFENEDISDTARVILMHIFKEYVLNPNAVSEEIKEDKKEKLEVQNIEEKQEEKIENIEEEEKELALVEVKKESLYQRIINFFKKIFSFRKNKMQNLEEE